MLEELQILLSLLVLMFLPISTKLVKLLLSNSLKLSRFLKLEVSLLKMESSSKILFGSIISAESVMELLNSQRHFLFNLSSLAFLKIVSSEILSSHLYCY